MTQITGIMEPPSYLSLSRAHHGLVDRDTIQKRDGFINRRKLLLDYILRIAGFQPAHICWRVVVFIYFLLTTCISGYLGYVNHTICSFYSATIFSLQLQSFILYCTGYFILNNSFKERLVNNLPKITANFKLILQKEFLWTTCIISLSYFSGAFIFVEKGLEPLTFAYTIITNIFDVIRYLPLITIIALIRSFYRPFLYKIKHIRQQHGIWSNYNSTLESHMYQCDIEDIKKDINAILQDYRNMMQKKRFTLWISIYMFCNIISIILFWASILSSDCSQTKKEMWPHYVHYTTELVVYFFAWIFLIFPMYRCDKALSSLVTDIITRIEYSSNEYVATMLHLQETVNQSIFSVGNWRITINRLAKILLFVSLTVTFDVAQTEAEFSILIGVFLFLHLLLVTVDILTRYFTNRALQNVIKTHQKQSIQQNSEIQNRIRNALTAVEPLFNLVNQTWLSNNPSLIVEYTTGNGANGSSSSNQSDKSGESKRNNDGQQGNNSNERKYNDDNHNDNNDRKDNNSDENENGSCITHEYNCGVSWHAVRLKQLEEENWKLKSLLQKQTANGISIDEIDATENKTPVINLKTTKKLTKKEIPDRIAESFCDVADYMNKYVHIYRETAIQDYTYDVKDIKVIDYGFHCKKTLETLYGVHVKNVQTETNDILWKTVESLYCASKLQEIYNIQNLSFPVNISDQILTEIKHAKEQVSQLLQNQKQRDNIIRNKNTPWGNQDNIPIVNKPSKQTGLTLVLEKHEFVEKVKSFADKTVNNIKLVPIVRFDENKLQYFYEIAWIVEIGEKINIAISFKRMNNGRYLPSAIYLDVYDQHKLVVHKHNCECLLTFNCVIDRLQIGQSKKTRMYQSYKCMMEKKVKEYENQMENYLRLRQQDLLRIDNIKQTCTDLKRNLQSLLRKQANLHEQQQTCNQLYTVIGLSLLPASSQSTQTYNISNQQ